jgi:hypothetical protein
MDKHRSRVWHIAIPEELIDWVIAQAKLDRRAANAEVAVLLEEAKAAREARENVK